MKRNDLAKKKADGGKAKAQKQPLQKLNLLNQLYQKIHKQ